MRWLSIMYRTVRQSIRCSGRISPCPAHYQENTRWDFKSCFRRTIDFTVDLGSDKILILGVMGAWESSSGPCTQCCPLTLHQFLHWSYLSYGTAIPFSLMSESDNIRIHSALNTAIRFIFCFKRDDRVPPYIREMGWLPANEYQRLNLRCQRP